MRANSFRSDRIYHMIQGRPTESVGFDANVPDEEWFLKELKKVDPTKISNKIVERRKKISHRIT